jgi:hypothetical protein
VGGSKQTEVDEVPVQQPLQLLALQPLLPPPPPLPPVQTPLKQLLPLAAQSAHARPPRPQLLSVVLLPLVRQLPSDAQQPVAQVAVLQPFFTAPHEGAAATSRPAREPKKKARREGFKAALRT